ncbi:unnamed protein product [Penicillium nalgiovense]|nr:unnamed protein product [Penicillium nalgiovense]
MLGATNVNLRYFFYPIGNTPAVNVFNCRVPPPPIHKLEEEQVKILFLACGDPRNLLFTLWCKPIQDEHIKWEFTCCDIEIAIIGNHACLFSRIALIVDFSARNIILFSLIVDNASSASIWKIFYHFFVTNADIAILKSQTDKLLSNSETPEIWSCSKYGGFIKFLSQDTLFRLRAFWKQYSSMAGLDADKAASFEGDAREEIQKTLKRNHEEDVIFLRGVRSATVHWARAMPVLSSCFRKFWETGVVAGNATDLHDLGEGGYGRLNPLFALSSAPTGKFAVHYGSDPLLAFHLASAFDDETCSEQGLGTKIVALAKFQFSEWCTALKSDALRLCYELQVSQSKANLIPKLVRAYTSPWSSTELKLLDLNGPLERRLFDIIETSNLVDHVGMLNVLLHLLRAAEDITAALPALLCSDVAAISLILGLSPSVHLIPYTASAAGLEEVLGLTASENTGRQSQYHMEISWRVPSFGDSIQAHDCSAFYQLAYQFDQLARYFFKLYLTMFSCEDMGSMMESMMRRSRSPLSVDLRHYNRTTFVILLSLTKKRVQTDWTSFMTCLLGMIQADRQLLVGATVFRLCPPHRVVRTPYGRPRACLAGTGLLGREGAPPIVYLALTVPRQKLDIFMEDKDPRGTPGLYVSVWDVEQRFDNSFFAIQCFFGQLKDRSVDNSICDVIPDHHGWRGVADLIVTCAVPTWSLLLGPREGIRIALTVSSAPSTCHYIPKLGIRMAIFECGLDSRNLRVLAEPPGLNCNPKKQHAAAEQNIPSQMEYCWVHLDEDSCAKTLRVQTASKVMTSDAKPMVTQVSPCTMDLSLQNSAELRLSYPYPIDGAQLKIKSISRGIELTVSIASALSFGGYNHNLFPIYMCERQPIPLLIPSIDLDKQAVIPVVAKLDWVKQFMGLMLSDRERKLYEERSALTSNPLLQLKISINAILQGFAGTNPYHGQYQIFQLVCKHKNNSSDTLIFASALRHNFLHGSILLDAYVVPLSKARVFELSKSLNYLVMSGKILSIVLKSREEEILWKKLLPVQAECCRQAWHHQESCQYVSKGLIPLSFEHSQLPICCCGENQDMDGFPRFQNWEALAEFATRIAIMPISAIPYLETFTSKEQKGHMSKIHAPLLNMGTSDEACDNCGQNVMQLKKCSQCGIVSYCDRDCQKAAWKRHKKVCRKD